MPLLARTARTMCTRQVRNRATLGGNVASGGPDRSLPPALLALDAKVTLASESGERELALDDFLAPFGTTNLGPDEIVTGVTVPLVRGFADFTQVGPRNAQYFPTAAVALVMDEDARNVRIGLANGADRACRSPEAEEFAGSTIDWAGRTVRDEVAVGFGRLVSEHSDPPGDLTATSDYRRHTLGVMASPRPAPSFRGHAMSDETQPDHAGTTELAPDERVSYTLRINGEDHRIDDAWYFEDLLRVLRYRARTDRHQVRLRARPVRGLHGAGRRGARRRVPGARCRCGRLRHPRPSRATTGPTASSRSSRSASCAMGPCNAGTARPGS